MENFILPTGTNVLFGRDQERNLPEILAGFGNRVLLAYGGGSIKKNGLYDKIIELLDGFDIVEFPDIEPNPTLTSVNRGVTLCRNNKIDVILAVGGGSVIDCSKVVAASSLYEGNPWNLVLDGSLVKETLPVVTVLTISATGSEMDNMAVITNTDTKEKLCCISNQIIPKVSILNPENTFTVSPFQTASGAADMMSHIFEVYFRREQSYISDRLCEGMLKTVIRYAPNALSSPCDYEARAELMWTRSLAISTFAKAGKAHAWSCHTIEHILSAYYNIPHGVGLAIITPHWMRRVLNEETVTRFAAYAVNVWGVTPSENIWETANAGIDATESFFKGMNIPMKLGELGITNECFDEIAEKLAAELENKNIYSPLNKDDILNILLLSL